MKAVLLAAVVLALTCSAAMAGGIPVIPIEGADVGLAYWSFPANDNMGVLLQLTAHPYKHTGVDTPTSWANLDDWAKSNLGIDVPFQGDARTFIAPLGLGLSEAVKVGTVYKVPIRLGTGWVTGPENGWGWFVKTDALSASF